MENQYLEQLVQCYVPTPVKIAKVLSIVGIVLFVLMIPSSGILGIVGCVLMAAAYWFSNRESGKEYEYIYVDGDISFDVIYNKSKRKSRHKTAWEETRVLCRAEAPELEGYRQRNAAVMNFTSHDEKNAKAVYALVTEKEGAVTLIYFEPEAEMIEMMWRKAPSRVKR